MTEVRAAIADGAGGFSIDVIEVGPPGPGEVQVAIKAAGLCHTDWDSIHTWKRRFVIGHEGAGVVTAVGEGVREVAPGDAVSLNWAIPCGACPQCARGAQNICERNSPVCGDGRSGHAHPEAARYRGAPIERSFHLGTLSELTVVREAAVTPLRTPIPFPSAALLSCGVMTGWGSAVNAAGVRAGATAAVIGCGGVGLNVIQACRIAGLRRIVAIDISEARLEQARRFGATDGLIADRDDADLRNTAVRLRALLGGGADYAFECTAQPALGAAPLALVRNGGVAIQASGIEQRISFDCELFEWDKIYLNPLYGQCVPSRDFPMLQELYARGALKLDELVTKTYPLEYLAHAFEDMLAGRLAKGVVAFD